MSPQLRGLARLARSPLSANALWTLQAWRFSLAVHSHEHHQTTVPHERFRTNITAVSSRVRRQMSFGRKRLRTNLTGVRLVTAMSSRVRRQMSFDPKRLQTLVTRICFPHVASPRSVHQLATSTRVRHFLMIRQLKSLL